MPGGVLILVIVLGALIWLYDLVKGIRNRQRAKTERDQLNKDLRTPHQEPKLPYGFDPDTQKKSDGE